MERETLLGWTNTVPIFPVLLSISEISTLSQCLSRKTDQLANCMNSLVGMKKPAAYPTKPFGSNSLMVLGTCRHRRESSTLLGAGNLWVRVRGDEVQSVVWEKSVRVLDFQPGCSAVPLLPISDLLCIKRVEHMVPQTDVSKGSEYPSLPSDSIFLPMTSPKFGYLLYLWQFRLRCLWYAGNFKPLISATGQATTRSTLGQFYSMHVYWSHWTLVASSANLISVCSAGSSTSALPYQWSYAALAAGNWNTAFCQQEVWQGSGRLCVEEVSLGSCRNSQVIPV